MRNLKTNKTQATYLQYIRNIRSGDKVEIYALGVHLVSSCLQGKPPQIKHILLFAKAKFQCKKNRKSLMAIP